MHKYENMLCNCNTVHTWWKVVYTKVYTKNSCRNIKKNKIKKYLYLKLKMVLYACIYKRGVMALDKKKGI